MSLIWQKVVTQSDYTFEDPICCSHVDITVYSEMYGPFLNTLDGQDEISYVDMFFRKSPVNVFHWEFIDSDARADFVDICQEMGLIDDLQKIREGTSGIPKKPDVSVTVIEIPRQPIKQKEVKKSISEDEKKERILAQKLNTIDILLKQSELATLSQDKREKNKQKIQRLYEQIQEDMDCLPIA